jgi:hypothetical protein
MATIKRQPEPSCDPRRVLAWRIDRLREVGCSVSLAEAIARDRRHDLHALLELVDQGCPPELAARITAPLDDHREPC